MPTKAERFKAAEQRGHQALGKRKATAVKSSRGEVRPPDAEGARHLTKRGAKNAAYALEGTPSPKRPSRKSTRRSGEKIKHATQLQRRELRRTTSPKARAARATAKRGTPHG